MTRRSLVPIVGLLFIGTALPAQEANGEGQQVLLKYIESLSRPDGGYGWADQPDSHLTPTFAAIGCYHLLNRQPPHKPELAAFIRTHHPITGEGAEAGKHAADLRSFIYEQIQSLRWLEEDARSFAPDVQKWTKVSTYPNYYEQHGLPILHQEAMAPVCRELLALPFDDLGPSLVSYFETRRRTNGSFNNTPADDGSEGNLLNTFWGLWATSLLRKDDPRAGETVAWLQACQLPSGGFAHCPEPDFAGTDDVTYTWAAVLSLKRLGKQPKDHEACIQYLLSGWNDDGGFGYRPGLPSDPTATYYTLAALSALEALDRLDSAPRRAPVQAAELPPGLKVFTIQLQAQGCGSPAEAVELARALRIHLWGAKNAAPNWIPHTQALARERQVPVTFCVANEEYGTFISLPGMGTYSHLADPAAPAGADFGRALSGPQATPWSRYRQERMAPLLKANGVMLWQICDNEEFSRLLLDDAVERGGHGAISTFHFPQNFVYMLPWMFRYRDVIPFVALQDSHGAESWWWADELTGYRTVFLAKEPTWEGWLEALKRNWVVAIRHDEVTRFRTRLLGGAPGVQAYVRKHESDWKWWGDRPDDLLRPWASLVAVQPGDEFEEGRPERGVALRLRCWWQGRPKRNKPFVELVSLKLDGNDVKTNVIEKKDQGKLMDVYHHVVIADPAEGHHKATAVVRLVGTERTAEYSVEFVCP